MNKEITYTISARGKKLNQPIKEYLDQHFSNIPLLKIDSVFGFVEPSTLYGGRPYLKRQISDKDYDFLCENNIGLRLPFTNHFCSRKEFESYAWLFEKYHKKGNSIICTNDNLVTWIKKDFPLYELEASFLKDINTQEKVNVALKNFDTVVLSMSLNEKKENLSALNPKSSITLFGNAGCALTCPNRICYEYLSKKNKKLCTLPKLSRYLYFIYHIIILNSWCSFRIKPRKLHGIKDFDLVALNNLGFRRFKMLRENKNRNTGF